jgi:N-acetylglucosaminyldiphosphoundecaprenol N-acetyl-beta-D-mannosaminyltransferase
VTTEQVLPARLLELVSSCFVGDMDDAVETIVSNSASGRGGYVCLCNVHVLTASLHDARLRGALSGAELRLTDGEPVAWLLRRLGSRGARRIGGPDLFPRAVDRGREVRLRHFLVGSTDPNLERLAWVLGERYPGAEVVGRHSPPHVVEPEVDEVVIGKIRAARSQVVWVGLGAPKQELWIARAARMLPGTMLIGVGAAFDFLIGTKPRAPGWMQRAGLEWLFRLASEPRRLSSRYLRSNSEFIARAAVELARRRIRVS